MIAVAERTQPTLTSWDALVQCDVACPSCGRHIAKSRHARELSALTVYARAYCLQCRKWRWYDVVTGLPPAHHSDGRNMVG